MECVDGIETHPVGTFDRIGMGLISQTQCVNIENIKWKTLFRVSNLKKYFFFFFALPLPLRGFYYIFIKSSSAFSVEFVCQNEYMGLM